MITGAPSAPSALPHWVSSHQPVIRRPTQTRQGYIGPLPASILSDKVTIKFDPVPKEAQTDPSRIVTTRRACLVQTGAATAPKPQGF